MDGAELRQLLPGMHASQRWQTFSYEVRMVHMPGLQAAHSVPDTRRDGFYLLATPPGHSYRSRVLGRIWPLPWLCADSFRAGGRAPCRSDSRRI